MQAGGVIEKYAIGGAVGATLYLEPAATLDVDIFVTVPVAAGLNATVTLISPTIPGSLLLSLAPLYDYLKARGGTVKDEHIVVGGWPVQFLPTRNELEREAVAESVATEVEGVITWVMSPEHLVAVALTTGRSKDHIRILQFIEQDAVDGNRLRSILDRHELTQKWKQFEIKYLEGINE